MDVNQHRSKERGIFAACSISMCLTNLSVISQVKTGGWILYLGFQMGLVVNLGCLFTWVWQ